MGEVLKYFMWGFQQHFLIAARQEAERVFGRVSPNLAPTVGLLGFLTESRTDRAPIAVEPEAMFPTPSQFASAANLTHWESARNEIVRALEADRDRRFYVGPPYPISGYAVHLILSLDEAAASVVPALHKEKWGNVTLPRSFLEAVVDGYLDRWGNALTKPDPKGINIFNNFDTAADLVRPAGRSFMGVAGFRTNRLDSFHSLFEDCCTLASLRYEGEEGRGELIIAASSHPNVSPHVIFEETWSLSRARTARKLLQLASGPWSLLFNGVAVWGLGEVLSGYDANREDLFQVRFVGHHHWQLSHANQVLMDVLYGDPRVPRSSVDHGDFRNAAQNALPGLSKEQLNAIWDLVESGARQRHGTMLVFHIDAKAEAERLRRQSMATKPFPMTPDLLQVLTNIDGAVLLDPHCRCHAIGVILDGLAQASADPGRGARYNSAIRYVHTSKACLAVVVSEDGSVEFFFRPHQAEQ